MVLQSPVMPGDVHSTTRTIATWLQASPVRALLANFSHPVFPGEQVGGKKCRKPAGRAPES